jgi:hypothetical protein
VCSVLFRNITTFCLIKRNIIINYLASILFHEEMEAKLTSRDVYKTNFVIL